MKYIWDVIAIGALLITYGFLLTQSLAATSIDTPTKIEYFTNVPYTAGTVCDTLEDMRKLIHMLNDGRNQDAAEVLATDNTFRCWFHFFEGVPFYPVLVHKKVETIGSRTIYQGTLQGKNELVYVFSIDPNLTGTAS